MMMLLNVSILPLVLLFTGLTLSSAAKQDESRATEDMCTGDYRAPRGTKCDKKCVAQSGYWGKSYCYMDDGSWGAECVKCPETCKSDEVITEANCLCDKVTCAIASTCTDGKTCTLPECKADEKIGIACLCDGKSCPIGNKCEDGKYCYSETCPADKYATCKSGWAYLCTDAKWGDFMLKQCATTCGCNECKADKKIVTPCVCNGKSCVIGSTCEGGTNCYSECKDGVNHKTTCMCKGKTCKVGDLCEECMLECKDGVNHKSACSCKGKICKVGELCEECMLECKDGVNHKSACSCKGKICKVGELCEECMSECNDGVNHKSPCSCKGKICKVGELCEECMLECKAGENFRSACLCDGNMCEVGNSCEGGKTCTPYLTCDNSVVVVPKNETCAAQRKKYCAISEGNTMCKYCGIDTKKCGKAICNFGITDEADIKRIVDSHNKLRRKIAKGLEKGGAKGHEGQPPAANMMKVVWDPEVARMAQTWVDQCSGAHDGNRNMESGYCGQNMAWMGGWRGGEGVPLNLKYTLRAKPLESPANMWYSEVNKYDKDTGKHTGVVGHFTQVVAAGVTRIGCGYLYKDEAKWLGTTITCNYCNGDYSYKGLYTVGEAGSKCPSGTKINDGLCELI